ncbi:unnamed protein product [Vitrella brassicaformis CCMP3155]|uniref:Uncharacterized protein n=1 Tax=Vitrella brassicaformis (strain CCMP3155) TaxID=1169540 RepID=A0A0G4G4V2_VITBC|nr:unnamed protein product [Vitrella brassicaformis CCMP3155]|eukprot:CEM23344.1 unnamed protein product [Vitrella brassicaformis CCMP3155]
MAGVERMEAAAAAMESESDDPDMSEMSDDEPQAKSHRVAAKGEVDLEAFFRVATVRNLLNTHLMLASDKRIAFCSL